MKHVLLGILLGNVVYFVGREAGSIIKASRNHECAHSVSTEKCKETTWLEKALLFELDLGSKVIDP